MANWMRRREVATNYAFRNIFETIHEAHTDTHSQSSRVAVIYCEYFYMTRTIRFASANNGIDFRQLATVNKFAYCVQFLIFRKYHLKVMPPHTFAQNFFFFSEVAKQLKKTYLRSFQVFFSVPSCMCAGAGYKMIERQMKDICSAWDDELAHNNNEIRHLSCALECEDHPFRSLCAMHVLWHALRKRYRLGDGTFVHLWRSKAKWNSIAMEINFFILLPLRWANADLTDWNCQNDFWIFSLPSTVSSRINFDFFLSAHETVSVAMYVVSFTCGAPEPNRGKEPESARAMEMEKEPKKQY